ncbi:serine/threonine-protein kinase PLK4-like [Glandiceps talaboti]
MAAAMSSCMGDSIEEYQVLNLLGKGGFACVYRGRSLKTGQEVAIKMIDKKMMHATGMVSRVRNEVEIHYQLKHPAILELYSCFEDADYVYLVLDMCHNGELNRYMKTHNKGLSEEKACHFLKQIVLGLLYLHSHGILHRDLTLANILLTNDMNPKIADFGLATKLSLPSEKHYTMCGTPNYISPEIATRSAHGLESDVWSLGCMLYTFLVGRPPFETEGVRSTLNKVMLAQYEVPKYISPEAKDLISKMLRKNPSDRISLSGLLDHPFMTKSDRLDQQDKHTSRNTSSRKFKSMDMSVDSGHATMATVSTGVNSSRQPPHTKPMKGRGPSFNTQATSRSNRSSNETTSLTSRETSQQISETSDILQKTQQISLVSKNDRSRNYYGEKSEYRVQNHANSVSGVSCASSVVPQRTINKSISSSDVTSRSHKEPVIHRRSSRSVNSVSQSASNVSGKYKRRNETESKENNGEDYHINYHSQKSSSNILREHSKNISTSSRNDRLVASNTETAYSTTTQVSSGDSDKTIRNSVHDQESSTIGHVTDHCKKIDDSRQLSQVDRSERFCDREKNYTAEIQQRDQFEYHEQVSDNIPREGRSQNKETRSHYTTGRSRHRSGEVGKECYPANSAKREVGKGSRDINGRLMISPLKASRLRPFRQRTRNAVVSILDQGDVCLEFVKSKEEEERVVEVHKISRDGLNITIFHPNKGKGLPVGEGPPSPSTCTAKMFSYDNLPSKYWKKYQYAVKFVQLVRTKTAKVTLYSKDAKCMLMENMPQPDFEVCFYNGGKVHLSASGVRVIEPNGTPHTLESLTVEDSNLSSEVKFMLDHVFQCHQTCLDLEATMQSLEEKTGQGPFFPIVVCRRPAKVDLNTTDKQQDEKLQPKRLDQEQHCVADVPEPRIVTSPTVIVPHISPSQISFNGTVYSTRTEMNPVDRTVDTRDYKKKSPGRLPKDNHVVKSVFVPEVGWASQLASGEVWVQYNDGSQLMVQVNNNTRVKFVDSKGNVFNYTQHDRIPDTVKDKLAKLSNVVQMFVTQGSKYH